MTDNFLKIDQGEFMRSKLLALCSIPLFLNACGGGSDTSATPAASSVATLIGTAATGAALDNAVVAIRNSEGKPPCLESTIVTSTLGGYSCTLKSGETAPFFVKVTDPLGNTPALVSIITETPALGESKTGNATPLTTAIIAQINGGNAYASFDSPPVDTAALKTALATATTNVVAQIKLVLDAISAPASYDPFKTAIQAATAGQAGNTADLILDIVKVTATPTGGLALSTVSAPTPVPMASDKTTGGTVVAPQASDLELAQAAPVIAAAFQQCFALQKSDRVTLDGNNAIVEIAQACDGIATKLNSPLDAPAFKHNGYLRDQWFYGLLTSNDMTNAAFKVEIMATYAIDTNNPRERAVLNLMYTQIVTGQKTPGNRITEAQKFPGSSTASRPHSWWLTGNQKDYDLNISTVARRDEKLNPNQRSDYRNGVRTWVEARDFAPQNAPVTDVRVTGPGLPTLGLWYHRTNYASGLIIVKERSATLPSAFTIEPDCTSCFTFQMSRTAGLSGTDATIYRSNSPYVNWAKGEAEGSYNGTNEARRPKKGDVYTFDIYGGTTRLATETRVLLTNLVDATVMATLPWNGIGDATKEALNPSGSLTAEQSSLLVDWTQNPAAERIRGVNITQINGSTDNVAPFASDASSVLASPTGGSKFTAFSTTSGRREVGFNYRILDGSSKFAAYTYDSGN